jgi:integrase
MKEVFERLLRMTTLETAVTGSEKLSARTRELYLSGIREFLVFAGDDSKKWTSDRVEKWRDGLLKAGQMPQTVNIKLNGLRYASRRMAEKGKNPALDFARFAQMLKPGKPKERKPLTIEQAKLLVAACEGEKHLDVRDKAICVLGLRTGLRRAAMCELLLSDLKGQKLHAVMKGGDNLTLYLDEETLGALHNWIKLLRAAGVKSGPVFRALSRPQLDGSVSIRSSALSTDGLYRAMKARAKKAGIKNFHPHIFRHTFIALAVEAGIPNAHIRAMTGQRSDSIIEQYAAKLKLPPDALATSHLPKFSADDVPTYNAEPPTEE